MNVLLFRDQISVGGTIGAFGGRGKSGVVEFRHMAASVCGAWVAAG